MKTRLLRAPSSLLALALLSLTAASGCVDDKKTVSIQTVPTPVIVGAPATVPPAPVIPPALPVSASPSSGNAADPAPPTAPVTPDNLSPGLNEVVKLVQSGVSEDVILAFIQSGRSFSPTADDIVFLQDLGVSETVLAALVSSNPAATPPPAAPVAAVAPAPAAYVAPVAAQPAPAAAAAPAVIETTAVAAPPAPAPPPQPVTVNYFYDSLAPYGSWLYVDHYGWCWQPTVVVHSPSWRPYCDRGRWIYSDCGWYWQSDYSWGWAAFHYGRWHSHAMHGWVWMPDCNWGPAWVSWRYTDAHCGWAPLPPAAYYHAGVGFSFHNSHVGIHFDFGLTDSCYSFIPSHRFCDPHPYRHVIPRSQTSTVYNNSTVINNYISGNNNTIINEGIGRDRIASATGNQIKTVSVRESAGPANPRRLDRITRDGANQVVYRPSHLAPASTSDSRRHASPAPASPAASSSRDRALPVSLASPSGSAPASSHRQPPEARSSSQKSIEDGSSARAVSPPSRSSDRSTDRVTRHDSPTLAPAAVAPQPASPAPSRAPSASEPLPSSSHRRPERSLAQPSTQRTDVPSPSVSSGSSESSFNPMAQGRSPSRLNSPSRTLSQPDRALPQPSSPPPSSTLPPARVERQPAASSAIPSDSSSKRAPASLTSPWKPSVSPPENRAPSRIATTAPAPATSSPAQSQSSPLSRQQFLSDRPSRPAPTPAPAPMVPSAAPSSGRNPISSYSPAPRQNPVSYPSQPPATLTPRRESPNPGVSTRVSVPNRSIAPAASFPQSIPNHSRAASPAGAAPSSRMAPHAPAPSAPDSASPSGGGSDGRGSAEGRPSRDRR